MYGCVSWTIKKAEQRRIDAFELWCWRRLLTIPWTTGRSNQSILKEVNPKYSLEGCWSWSSNTLATWCDKLSHWKDPAAGQDWRQEEKGATEDEMAGPQHQLNGHEYEQALGVCDGQGSLVGHKESDTTEWLNWMFHCVYLPQLPYPYICQWTFRLLPCPSYCKQWSNEHWSACVSYNSGFLGVYA